MFGLLFRVSFAVVLAVFGLLLLTGALLTDLATTRAFSGHGSKASLAREPHRRSRGRTR